MTTDLTHIWREEKEKGLTMSIHELSQRTRRFESRIRRRNFMEYAASALVVGTFGWMATVVPDAILKVACVVIIAGTLLVVRNLHRYGAVPADGAELATDCRAFYRAELVRQRDALRSVTRWYLAPLVPGAFVFEAGMTQALARELPAAAVAVTTAASVGILVAVFAGVRWLNLRGARQLDREIARLDRD